MSRQTEPFRLRVITALQKVLQQITPANGSNFDMSQAVFVGRDRFGDNDPIPLLCILEDIDGEPDTPSPRGATDKIGPWPLLVQGFVDAEPGDRPLSQAYFLAAEVEALLAKEMRRASERTSNAFGMRGRVDKVYFSKAIVRPADGEVSDKAYFWLRVTLDIVENLLDPYE